MIICYENYLLLMIFDYLLMLHVNFIYDVCCKKKEVIRIKVNITLGLSTHFPFVGHGLLKKLCANPVRESGEIIFFVKW